MKTKITTLAILFAALASMAAPTPATIGPINLLRGAANIATTTNADMSNPDNKAQVLPDMPMKASFENTLEFVNA